MLTLGSTPIASTYYLVKVGGDIALLKGIMKTLVALDAKSLAEGGPGVLDRDFIANHTTAFSTRALTALPSGSGATVIVNEPGRGGLRAITFPNTSVRP